jgi:hypothetical protein
MLAFEPREIGEEGVAGPTLRIAEDEQYASPALVGERDRATREIGKLERRRRDTRLQPFALDQALGERTLARQVPAATRSFLYELGDLTRADGNRLRDAMLVVQEVGDRRTHMCKPCDRLAVTLKKDGAVKAMCL